MGLLSSIKSAISKVTKQPAAAAMSFPVTTAAGRAAIQGAGYTAPPKGSATSGIPPVDRSAPAGFAPLQGGDIAKSISTGQAGVVGGATAPQNTFGGGGSPSISAESLSYSQPVVSIASGGGTTSVGGSGGGGAGITNSSIFSSAFKTPNDVTFDPKTGIYTYSAKEEPTDQTTTPTTDIEQMFSKYFPQKESVYESQQYKQAQADYESKKATERQLSGQLTSIINTAQAQALAETGQGRGIPEAIIGGRQAQIYKEAAIQALPIQAQLAIAQGDVQGAQEHLTNLTTMLTEQINSKYDYQKALGTAVINYATDVQKAKINGLLKEKEGLKDTKLQLLAKVVPLGAPESVRNAIMKATTPEQAIIAAGGWASPIGGSGGGAYTPTSSESWDTSDNFSSAQQTILASGRFTAQQRADVNNLLTSQGLPGAQRWWVNNKFSAAERDEYNLYGNASPILSSVASDIKQGETGFGPYTSIAQSSKPWLLIKKDQRYADLRQRIEFAQAQVRKGFYGTAVTGAESGNANNFLINDSDDTQTVITKVSGLANLLKFANDANSLRPLGVSVNMSDYLGESQATSEDESIYSDIISGGNEDTDGGYISGIKGFLNKWFGGF